MNAADKKAYMKEYRLKNRERLRSYDAEQRIQKREKRAAQCAEWRKRNQDRAREYGADYRRNNPERKRLSEAKRRAAKVKATVAWQHPAELEAFYIFCPDGYHVDHDAPLQGDLICGLHVLENLRYLTAEENLAKNKTFKSYTEIKATGERIYLNG